MKLVIYTLNEDGSIPDYILDGGYFPVKNTNASPQDFNILGLATDNAQQNGFIDKNALFNYFENNNLFETNATKEEIIPTEVLVDIFWNKLDIFPPTIKE